MNELAQKLGTLDLFFELVKKPTVKEARVYFFGSENDGVGFFNSGKVGAVGNDISSYVSLQNVPEFVAVLGIRSQYENCRRLDFPVLRFRQYRTGFRIVGLTNTWLINLTINFRCYLAIKTD